MFATSVKCSLQWILVLFQKLCDPSPIVRWGVSRKFALSVGLSIIGGISLGS